VIVQDVERPPPRVGRFVSAALQVRERRSGERGLYSPVYGYQWDRVEVVCTVAEYLEPRLHEWITECLLCRLDVDGALTIEVRR
jgi:hypothetical protein